MRNDLLSVFIVAPTYNYIYPEEGSIRLLYFLEILDDYLWSDCSRLCNRLCLVFPGT